MPVLSAGVMLFLLAATPVAAQSNPPSCAFTDNLIPGVTPIRAVHLTEVRSCIDSVRAWLSLGAYDWSVDDIVAGVTEIHANDVIELALALNGAYQAAGMTPPSWGPAPTQGATVISVGELHQIRSALSSLVSTVSCSYTVTATDVLVAADGGGTTLDVSTFAGCGWTTSSSASWITLQGTGQGSGNGQVAFVADPNTGTDTRVGTLSVGGVTVTVRQLGSASLDLTTFAGYYYIDGAQNSTQSLQSFQGASSHWICQASAGAKQPPQFYGDSVFLTMRIKLDGVVKASGAFGYGINGHNNPAAAAGTIGYVAVPSSSDRVIRCEVEVTGRGWTSADNWSRQYTIPASAGTLKLFLDVPDASGTFDFNPENPEDELAMFVPGSGENGDSFSVPSGGQPIHRVRVIAAFVSSGGQIVEAPAGTSINFDLVNNTRFAGMAMNWPDSRGTNGLDYTFSSGTQTSVTFASGVTHRWVEVNVWDYGGSVMVRASPSYGGQIDMRLPQDANNNRIADAGWSAAGDQVLDQSGLESADDDGDPVVDGPPTVGLVGDGLSGMEEYRGFIVSGAHTRTHPSKKDLFVASNVTHAGVDIGLGFISTLPLVVHRIKGQDEDPFAPEYRFSDRVVNANFSNGSSGSAIPHQDQKALRIRIDFDNSITPVTARGITLGSCNSGGLTPNDVTQIKIDVTRHQNVGFGYGNTTEQIQNELRKSVAHELGHGIHINHRNDAQPENCDDGANTGIDDSVMTSQWFDGPPASDSKSQFNVYDLRQIRIRVP